MRSTFTYLELFAGVGGLGDAIAYLGGECVFACELDESARQQFLDRHPDLPATATTDDILTLTHEHDGTPSTTAQIAARLPTVDVVAGGPPCQDFSKSGAQAGAEGDRGILTVEFFKVVEAVKPKVVVCEQVRNVAGRRHRATYDWMLDRLDRLGYDVMLDDGDAPLIRSPHRLSPEAGGTPQFRERIFLIGVQRGTDAAEMFSRDGADLTMLADGYGYNPDQWHVDDLLEDDDQIDDLDAYALKPHHIVWIDAWNRLLQTLPEDRLPAELWADAFTTDLHAVLEAHQVDEAGKDHKRRKLQLSHDLYMRNRDVIDPWLAQVHPDVDGNGTRGTVHDFPKTRRVLEFQARSAQPTREQRNLWACSLQLRASGIRVKPLSYLPALVALNNAPVIGPRRRTITPREAWRLQALAVPVWSPDVTIPTSPAGHTPTPPKALHTPRTNRPACVQMPPLNIDVAQEAIDQILAAWDAAGGVSVTAVDAATNAAAHCGLDAGELLVAAASYATMDPRFNRPGIATARLLWDTYTLLAHDQHPAATAVSIAACDWRVRSRMYAAAGRCAGQHTTADAMRHATALLPLALPSVNSPDRWAAAAEDVATAIAGGWPADWAVRLTRSRLLSAVGTAPGQRNVRSLQDLHAALIAAGIVEQTPAPDPGPNPSKRAERLAWAQQNRSAHRHVVSQQSVGASARLWLAEVSDTTAHRVVETAQSSWEAVIAEQGLCYDDEGAEWSSEEFWSQVQLADAYAMCVAGVPDVPTMVELATYERFRQSVRSSLDIGVFDDAAMTEHFGTYCTAEDVSYRLWGLAKTLSRPQLPGWTAGPP